MADLNELPKYQPEPKKEQGSSDSKIMEWLMVYGWAILVVLIAIGALFYFGVFNIVREEPETTTTTSTSIIPTTTISSIRTQGCPEKFLRKDIDGNLYCPKPSVFACKSYDNCPVDIEDELFTTTSITTSTTTSETSEEITTTIEDTLELSGRDCIGRICKK